MESMGLYTVVFFDKDGDDIYLDMDVKFKGYGSHLFDSFETITEAVEFGKEMIKTIEPLADVKMFRVYEDWSFTKGMEMVEGDYIEIELNQNPDEEIYYLMDKDGDCWGRDESKSHIEYLFKVIAEDSFDDVVEKYGLKIVRGGNNPQICKKMMKYKRRKKVVDWGYFKKFDGIKEKYLPDFDEGETKANQIVTAVTRLIYKYYNNGDVYDNAFCTESAYNDLSSYANWLIKYSGMKKVNSILKEIFVCYTEADYTNILKELADTLLVEEYLTEQDKIEKVRTIYKCDGCFKFDCPDD